MDKLSNKLAPVMLSKGRVESARTSNLCSTPAVQ